MDFHEAACGWGWTKSASRPKIYDTYLAMMKLGTAIP